MHDSLESYFAVSLESFFHFCVFPIILPFTLSALAVLCSVVTGVSNDSNITCLSASKFSRSIYSGFQLTLCSCTKGINYSQRAEALLQILLFHMAFIG